MAPLLIVTGTGTEIGKTVVATNFVRAWSRSGPVIGIKPVESGGNADGRALEQASTFHVTRFSPPYLFKAAVSPHLAARMEGRRIALGVLVEEILRIRNETPAVVLELPGGLFSPLNDDSTNADLIHALAALPPVRTVLVASDRLGVLHDVIVCARAAATMNVALDGIVLSGPAASDASTGTNAAELTRMLPAIPVLTVLPRRPVEAGTPDFTAALAPTIEQLGLARVRPASL